SRPARCLDTRDDPGRMSPSNYGRCQQHASVRKSPGRPNLVNATTALRTYLDFEKPILELENKVAELKALQTDGKGPQIADEIARLEQKARAALIDTYAKLTPWQKTLVARHPERPHALDFINSLTEDFTPLAGDRYFAEDEAIVGGLGKFRNRSVVVL